MWYYLETNALVSLGAAIARIPSATYTSYWAVSELLKRLDAERYPRQHKLANNMIQNSDLRFDWDDEQQKLYSAFGVRPASPSLSVIVKEIFTLLATEPLYSEFLEHTAERGLTADLHVIRQHEVFADAFRTGIANPITGALKEFFNKTQRLAINELINDRRFLLNSGIASLAQILAEASKTPARVLREKYNRSLDTYLVCRALYFNQKLRDAAELGKNDDDDLTHLMYLQNTNCAIVTDDAMLHSLLRTHLPAQIVPVSDFRHKLRPRKN